MYRRGRRRTERSERPRRLLPHAPLRVVERRDERRGRRRAPQQRGMLVPGHAEQRDVPGIDTIETGDTISQLILTLANVETGDSLLFGATSIDSLRSLWAMIAALFGSSRQLATGPVAIVSLLTATVFGSLAEAGTASYI